MCDCLPIPRRFLKLGDWYHHPSGMHNYAFLVIARDVPYVLPTGEVKTEHAVITIRPDRDYVGWDELHGNVVMVRRRNV